MTIERKLVKTSGATAEAVYVEDVFSTLLYTGNETARTINNGIDLATKGGLVWTKSRPTLEIHNQYDTARGANKLLYSNGTPGEITRTAGLTSFTSSGYTLGIDGNYEINSAATNYVSWTFRKQPKFFDVVTYTGDGTANRQIAHALGSTPGMVIVKRTDSTGQWPVWHRSLNGTNYALYLNLTLDANSAYQEFSSNGSATMNSATFCVSASGGNNNHSGATYVAYLFAHDAGGFGAAGTDSVVSCGSFTKSASWPSSTPVVLGWEPQFLLFKRVDSGSENWNIADVMRGDGNWSGTGAGLVANSSAAETSTLQFSATPTGFTIGNSSSVGGTYIYLAIRRGPMKTPTDATKVYKPILYTGNGTNSRYISGFGFPLDMFLFIDRYRYAGYNQIIDRLRGGDVKLQTWSAGVESKSGLYYSSSLAAQDGYIGGTSDSNQLNGNDSLMAVSGFRRAPGFFDVVCYTGTGSARTVAHNLGVAPELIITKSRSTSSTSWVTYHKDANGILYLDLPNGRSSDQWAYSNITSASYAPAANDTWTNATGVTYVAYLFASCPGVSKVGSYIGSETTKQIDCGFAAGARFVLIKRTDSTADWYVWDTARGIVSGNDPYLLLNSNAAEVTNTDYIDPYSAGFEISSSAPAAINAGGGTFIYLAIA